jgi:hypothetical protein
MPCFVHSQNQNLFVAINFVALTQPTNPGFGIELCSHYCYPISGGIVVKSSFFSLVEMWLINTTTLELERFTNHPKNKYAILSHRWEAEEVSFQSWKARTGEQSLGYRKVVNFVKKAASHGYEYAWSDTCCINKESSAELSESINSMFMVCL